MSIPLPAPKCYTCGADCLPLGGACGRIDTVDYRWYCAIHMGDKHYPRSLCESDTNLPIGEAMRREIDRQVVESLMEEAQGSQPEK